MQEDFGRNKQKLITELGVIIKSLRQKQNKSIYTISAEALTPKTTWR